MSESPEFIGSMPSVPQRQSPPQMPEQKPGTSNLGGLVGFSFCAVCLLVFPFYAQTDALGTGIFDGMGAFLLFLTIVGSLRVLAKRAGTSNKPPKVAKARPATGSSRRVRQLNGILLGVALLLLGVYLLTSPDLVDINIFGLFFLIVGIGVIFFAIVGIFRSRRRLAEFESGAGSAARSQQTKSQILLSGLYMLFAGACLFVFPRIMGANAFVRGFLYGIGLIILMLAMLVLGNALSMRRSAQVSPGQ
jgi:hypothetical protein